MVDDIGARLRIQLWTQTGEPYVRPPEIMSVVTIGICIDNAKQSSIISFYCHRESHMQEEMMFEPLDQTINQLICRLTAKIPHSPDGEHQDPHVHNQLRCDHQLHADAIWCILEMRQEFGEAREELEEVRRELEGTRQEARLDDRWARWIAQGDGS
jgi:hypothetical protein